MEQELCCLRGSCFEIQAVKHVHTPTLHTCTWCVFVIFNLFVYFCVSANVTFLKPLNTLSQGQELNLSTTLASQPAAGLRPVCGDWLQTVVAKFGSHTLKTLKDFFFLWVIALKHTRYVSPHTPTLSTKDVNMSFLYQFLSAPLSTSNSLFWKLQ